MLEMRQIHKRYGRVHANRGIDLTVSRGKIVGLLGENGSGKSTLMKVLFGVVRADAGSIRFKDRALASHSPGEAIGAGIGMIHQHFMLVDAMTVAENVMLGWRKAGRWLRGQEIAVLIRSTSRTYGLDIEPDDVVGNLSYGRRQRVEIMKALLRDPELLVLDEPTSNLSPPEISHLLDLMRQLRDQGRSVIFISHKLGEVLDVCDDIVVLRDGKVSGRCSPSEATRAGLAQLMVGRDVTTRVEPARCAPGAEMLKISGLSLHGGSGVALHDINFSVRAGEILSVAGVDGNGQAELVEVIAGLRLPERGRISLAGSDITGWTPGARLTAGLAYIPADRSGTSLVPGMSVADNLALREFNCAQLSRWCWLDRGGLRTLAADRIGRFRVRAGGADVPARTLSGGNQQKVVLAREIGRNPKALIAVQPTAGLDPGATRFVIDQLCELRAAGGAILYVSAELEEVLALGDRIAVIHNGRLSDPVDRARADITAIGMMMAGVDGNSSGAKRTAPCA
jgi:general nucleoside transport system ATP-binding protein